MMKKLFSLFVILALVLSMIPAVYADGTSFKIAPSAAAAEIGDTVEFTVTATGNGITAAQFEVSIPEGLTFVEGSGAVPADLKGKLGWAGIDWTEGSMMWTGYNDTATDIPANTVILTFSCKVEAEGDFDVALVNFEVFDADFSDVEVDASGAVESVQGTKPATPDEPVEATPDEPTGDNGNVDDNKPEQKPEDDNKPEQKPEDDNKPEQKPEQKPEDDNKPEQKPEDEKEPEQKPEDDKKPEADDKVEENPKTSGNSAIVTFVVMMAASCAVLFTVLMGKKKFMA